MFTPHLYEFESKSYQPGEQTHREYARLVNQAESLYRSAHLRGMFGRALARLTGRPRRLLVLSEVLARAQVQGRRYAGLRTVDVSRIVGTESRAEDFDAAFNPISEHNRFRWTSMAKTFLQYHAVPPVDLIQVGGAYFVRDGHHRVSVARIVGQAVIEAEVTVMEACNLPEAMPQAAPALLARLNDCPA